MSAMTRRISALMTACLLAISGALWGTGAAAQPSPAHKVTGQVVPAYGLGYWPGTPELCVLDRTDGMPVAEAVAEFERTVVTMTLEPDCGHADATIAVVLGDYPDSELAGWADWTKFEYDAELGLHVFNTDIVWVVLNNVWDHMDTEQWRAALVHELGHAIGLGHTTRLDSIMNLDIYEHPGLTDTDVAVINELYGS